MMGVLVSSWGAEFIENDWAIRILSDSKQNSVDRVNELFLYFAYKFIGPEAVDFSSYSILKFKSRYPDVEYENQDIHIASHMALDIAKNHDITDLLNTYSCVEIILFTSVDFIKDPVCSPIKTIFENKKLSADEKLINSFGWLRDNLAKVTETIRHQNGISS